MRGTMNGHSGKDFWVRVGYALLGVAVIGLGASILQVGGVGVDPYTALNIGVSDQLGWTLGSYQLLSNIVLFIPVLIWGRQYIGWGSVINMVMTGFFIDLFSAVLELFVPDERSLLVMTVFFVLGSITFAFGASAYMTAGLGTAPYDAIAPMIVDHTRWEYQKVRVPQDVLVVASAVLFRGPVGFGTVMTAFFNGPLIQFFTKRVHQPVLAKLTGSPVEEAG